MVEHNKHNPRKNHCPSFGVSAFEQFPIEHKEQNSQQGTYNFVVPSVSTAPEPHSDAHRN
jgi:hypothetical protein